MTTENIDLAKLADTVREVRCDLYALATGPQRIGRYCICGLDPRKCDTICNPDDPSEVSGSGHPVRSEASVGCVAVKESGKPAKT